MTETYTPKDPAELAQIIGDANAEGRPLEARGGGSKAAFGGWPSDYDLIDMSGLTGVVDYDPAAKVITARAGTPLGVIEPLLAAENQMLAFEPMDYAPILGGARGRTTLGGLLAANAAGPRRLSAGGVRDHLLGFKAVTGRGEAFQAGGPGKAPGAFDLAKLMAGSWGSLTVLTEITFKTAPAARDSASLVLRGLDEEKAVAVMAAALGTPVDVSGAAHLPRLADRDAFTLLRLEGAARAVAARLDVLHDALSEFGKAELLPTEQSKALWASIRDVEAMSGDGALWRVSLPPARAAEFTDAMAGSGATWLMDWAGGLVWLQGPAEAGVRSTAVSLGGQAILVRPGDAADTIPAFPPEPPALAALSARVKQAFDPKGILADRRSALPGGQV